MPAHNHLVNAYNADVANIANPAGNSLGVGTQAGNTVNMYRNTAPNVALNAATAGIAGSSQPHQNMQPFLTISFCIAIQGIFPRRPS